VLGWLLDRGNGRFEATNSFCFFPGAPRAIIGAYLRAYINDIFCLRRGPERGQNPSPTPPPPPFPLHPPIASVVATNKTPAYLPQRARDPPRRPQQQPSRAHGKKPIHQSTTPPFPRQRRTKKWPPRSGRCCRLVAARRVNDL
jgi:hypothetical protein